MVLHRSGPNLPPMDPLDLEPEDLLSFFRRNKTEMSCMETPLTFIRQLRDHDLMPEDRFEVRY